MRAAGWSTPTGSRLLGTRSGPPVRPWRSGRADAGVGVPREDLRVALCVPLSGPEGIWGPSCMASAGLAQSELNADTGIAGRQCELHMIDASSAAADVEHRIGELARTGAIDAIVGMCISSVRQRIVAEVQARVPFVYTCLYEGGDRSPGLYTIGETAAAQLRPSIAWLAERRRVRRWMLLGNDYIWPRRSHAIARERIAACGGEVVAEALVPFGVTDYTPVFECLRTSRADALLISMVGQDAVEFNRAFGRLGLQRRVLRLSCAIEENQLLAIGADNTEDLYVALGYFAALPTDANIAFQERYRARHGQRAPVLNSIGQSLYEGLHFLGALLEDRRPRLREGHASARRADGQSDGVPPIYLARADGHGFQVLRRLPAGGG